MLRRHRRRRAKPERQHVQPIIVQLEPLLHHVLDSVRAPGPGAHSVRTLYGIALDGSAGAAERSAIDQRRTLAPEQGRDDDHGADVLALEEALDVARRVQGDGLHPAGWNDFDLAESGDPRHHLRHAERHVIGRVRARVGPYWHEYARGESRPAK